MILVLRALKLGDLLAAVPALRAIRGRWPGEVVLACPSWLEPIVRLTGAVDRVLPTPGLAPLPVERPEVAVNLHGAGPQSREILEATRPGMLISHGGRGPRWRDDQHERDRWCALLTAAGLQADPTDLRLRRPEVPSPEPGAVVVHPGAAFGSRMWPAERFAQVVDRLVADGRKVVVTGNDAERGLAEKVARDRAVTLAGRTPLPELAALVADAELVIAGDTGVAHLSYAYGTPSVVLFGPVGPELWGPPPGPHIAMTDPAARRGEAFADDPDPALLAVTPDDVIAAAARLCPPSPRRD